MKGNEQSKNKIKQLEDLYEWEQSNLPIVTTNSGYKLLFYIFKTNFINDEEIRLKNIYYSLPYSEKTLRLLLRELEKSKWIEISKKNKDARYRDVIVKRELLELMELWLEKIENTIIE